MKKIALFITLFMVFSAIAFGQDNPQTLTSPTPQNAGTLTPAQDSLLAPASQTVPEGESLAQSQTLATDAQTAKNEGGMGIIEYSLGFKFKKENDTKAFRDDFQAIFGKRFSSNSPMYAGVGFGYSLASTYSRILGNRFDTDQTILKIPICIGFVAPTNFRLSVKAGPVFNYLARYEINGDKQDLSGTDRTSWNGWVQFNAGPIIKKGSEPALCFMARYEFPFQSGGKGVWLFGISFGIF